MDRLKREKLGRQGKICYECGSKNVITVYQGYARKYGFCRKHVNYPIEVK